MRYYMIGANAWTLNSFEGGQLNGGAGKWDFNSMINTNFNLFAGVGLMKPLSRYVALNVRGELNHIFSVPIIGWIFTVYVGLEFSPVDFFDHK